jgi:ATP-binding cassette subfamily C protein
VKKSGGLFSNSRKAKEDTSGKSKANRAANDGSSAHTNTVRGAFAGARRHIMLAAIFSAAVNILYLAPSLYMLQVYDRVLVSGGLLTLAFLSAVALVALIVMALLDALRTRVMARLSLRLDMALATPVMEANFQARNRGIDARDFSGVRDLDTLRQGVSSPGAVALLDVPWTPFFIMICFAVHVSVGVLATVGAIAIFAVAWLNERASRVGVKEITQAAPLFYGGLEADMRAAETARAMGMEPALIARRLKERVKLVSAQTRTSFVSAHYGSAAKFLRMLLQSATLCLGAYLAVNQQITAGAIIAVTILTARGFAPIEQVVSSWKQTQQAWLAFRSLETALKDFAEDAPRTRLPAAKGKVELTAIVARHPGVQKPALVNITATLPAGDITGIIGPSGAGKSTLARIIANACSPASGAVRLDGARYQDWPRDQLAQAIGYLPQSVDLLSGTIAENIRRFAPITDAGAERLSQDVVKAAKAAGVHDLILNLPMAYDTPIGAGGKGLSFGQAQRVGLARALYGDPMLLVLDEPNAHVDDEGELALIAAMQSAKARGASVVVVAHRSRLISAADNLLVLRDGSMIEMGPREQVIAKMQASIAAAQASGGSVSMLRARPQGGVE